MAEFEIIEDVAKTIPKGKDLKKYMPFIIAGVGAGVVALILNKGKGSAAADTTTAYDESGVASDVDLGGVMSDFANQTSESLDRQNESLSYQLSEVSANLFDVVNDQNETIYQMQQQQEKALQALKDQLAEGSTYSETTEVQTTVMKPTTISSGSSIYFDGNDDDDVQYQDRTRSANTVEEKAAVAGLGNNGIGWTEENFADNADRLASDPTYQRSEVERTNLVIANRKKAGLSTAAQESYLKGITQ